MVNAGRSAPATHMTRSDFLRERAARRTSTILSAPRTQKEDRARPAVCSGLSLHVGQFGARAVHELVEGHLRNIAKYQEGAEIDDGNGECPHVVIPRGVRSIVLPGAVLRKAA